MTKRLVGVVALVLLVLAMAVPAGATEGGGEEPAPPEFEEICNPDNPVVLENCPPAYEEPSVFPPILYGLLVIAAVVAIALLLLYLVWQPRFAQERDRVKGRR